MTNQNETVYTGEPFDFKSANEILAGNQDTIEQQINNITFLGEDTKEYLMFPHPDNLSEDKLKALASIALMFMFENDKIDNLY